MPFIRESIITTLRDDGQAHIAPMGIHEDNSYLIVAPFKPSTTLDNIRRNNCATINYSDDVRIYAGCVTGKRYDWPTVPTEKILSVRLEDCLAHGELEVVAIKEDDLRPRFTCKVVHEVSHAPFHGYNRAQFAVIELSILVTRLHMLPWQKIEKEIEYLKIGLEKTAGPREQEAWEWLMEKVNHFKRAHKEVNV